jgi:soluble lytic murein transglycosylase-like protein
MRKRLLVGVAGALIGLAPAVHAAEIVTLTNGYAMRCDHHVRVEDRVRLYIGMGEDNYIEFSSQDIAGVEQVADPVPAAPVAPPAAKAADARLASGDLNEMLAEAGKTRHIDVDLLASVVKAESDGNARAQSRAGAQGLMQLMPQTAAELGVADSFQPRENVRGGSAYLDALLTRYHDNMALALAAYNAGPAAVDRYHGIPPYHETRLYVARVITEFNRKVMARQMQTASAGGSQQAGEASR